MARKTWFSVTAKADDADVFIFDEIGLFGITAGDFAKELKALGDVKAITLRINSPGGVVFDALAIYNMLAKHAAKITVRIEGIAASAASVIAMAGDKIIMPSNSFVMVHNPLGFTMGDAADHAEMVELLEKIGGSLVGIYAARTGRGEDEIQAIMDAETWFTAEEAVAAGFADEIEEPLKVAASVDPARFRNAPAALTARTRQPSPDEIAEREQAAAIARLCADAGDVSLAADYIEAGLTLDDVTALLQDRAAARDALDDRLAKVRGDRTKGERAQQEIAASWDRAIAAVSRGQS